MQDPAVRVDFHRGDLLDAIGQVQVTVGIIGDPAAPTGSGGDSRIVAGAPVDDADEAEDIFVEPLLIGPIRGAGAARGGFTSGLDRINVDPHMPLRLDHPGITTTSSSAPAPPSRPLGHCRSESQETEQGNERPLFHGLPPGPPDPAGRAWGWASLSCSSNRKAAR